MFESTLHKPILLPSGRYRRLLPPLIATIFVIGCASNTAAREEAVPAPQPSAAESGAESGAESAEAPARVTKSSLGRYVDIRAIRQESSPVKPPENVDDGTAHLVFIARLIEESSAAQQVGDSENPAAHLRRNEAREYYRSAVDASAAGDAERADQLGKKATQMMLKAVRLAEADEVVEAKNERDYLRRLESVNALLDAHKRVGAEDELGNEFSKTRQVIRLQVARAETLHQREQLEDARERLDAAYVALKLSLQAARDGETRIQTLSFANKQEEYEHEVARNDTHQKLVGLFMQDSETSEGMQKMVDNFLGKASELREQAEDQADDGDHEDAVNNLTESTGQLIRALRTVGIFIPG